MPQPLLSAERVQARIDELAADLNRDFAEKNPLIVCILKGSYIFTADLSRRLTIEHEIDFMAASSYGSGTTSSGEVRLTKDLQNEIDGRHVLLVEDIVDTGNTLRFLMQTLEERNPESISVITLLRKEGVDEANQPHVDYVGFTVPPLFVVGYGLDYAEQYRHLPYVAALAGVSEPGEEQEEERPEGPAEE